MKHKLTAVLLCIVLLLSFSSCAKDSVGCFIYYPVYDDMTSLDPQIARSDTEKLIVTNCFEGLVRVDENGEIVGGAASDWNISPDGKTYTFYLRANAKWNITDYTAKEMADLLPENFAPAVTADDFVFALQRALDPATGAADAYLLNSIENAREVQAGTADVSSLGVRAVANNQLEITLSEPQSNFLHVLTECICMPCNRTFFEACGGRYGMMVRHYMSNGPFFLYSFTDADYTLYASETYNGNHKPTPTKVFLYYNKNGNNVPDKMSQEFYSGAYMTDAMFTATDIKRSTTVTELQDTVIGFVFNLNHEILKNANVRKGIAYATDAVSLAEMGEQPYIGSLIPSVCGFTPACVNLYDEDLAVQYLLAGFEELSQPKFIEVPVVPEEQPTEESELADPNAPPVLPEEEAPTEDDGSVGPPETQIQIVEVEEVTSVELTVLTSEEYADLIKRQMQKWQRILGLRCIIRIETVNETLLRSRVAAGDYEIAFCPLSVRTPDPLGFLLRFTPDSPDNCISLADAEYEALTDAAKAAVSTAEQQQHMTAAADYLQEAGCMIPVFSESSYLVQTSGVSGIYCYTGPDRVYFNNAFSEN